MPEQGARMRDLYVTLDRVVREGGSDDQREMLALVERELFGGCAADE